MKTTKTNTRTQYKKRTHAYTQKKLQKRTTQNKKNHGG